MSSFRCTTQYTIFDAEVVQSPSTSIVIDRPTVIYLVVNDATCDRSDPVTHAAVDVAPSADRL